MEFVHVEPTLFNCCNQIKPFHCKVCPSFQTNFLEHLRHHVISGHREENLNEKIYKCPRCSLVTFSRFLHLRHGLFGKCTTTDEEETGNPLQCHMGDGTFAVKEEGSTVSPHEDHQTIDVCKSESFINSRGESHAELSHSGSDESHIAFCNSNPEDVQWFKCDQCPSKYTVHTSLKSCIKQSHSKLEDIVWFKCDQCPSNFKERSSLKRHTVARHTEWFNCGKCPAKFNQKTNLKFHVTRLHSKSKEDNSKTLTLTCYDNPQDSRCDSNFQDKATITPDIQLEDQQWFKCDQCPSDFAEVGSLTKHTILCHSKPEDLPWFGCDQCPSKFKYRFNLQAHQKTDHDEPKDVGDDQQWFKCDKCPCMFKLKRNFDRHVISCQWVKCDHCPVIFEEKSSLEKHMSNCHAQPEDSPEGSPKGVQLLICQPDKCFSAFKRGTNVVIHREWCHYRS